LKCLFINRNLCFFFGGGGGHSNCLLNVEQYVTVVHEGFIYSY